MTPAQAAELRERAQQLQRLARNDEALELLEGCEHWPSPYDERALVLRASVLCEQDPIAALDSLPENPDAFTAPDARFEYLSVCGRAYIKTRNLRASGDLLEKARGELRDENDPNRYSVAIWAAYLQWNRREYDPKSPDLLLAVQSPDLAMRVRALNLQAWMFGGLEDYRSLLDGVLACLDLYEQYGDRCGLRITAESLRSAGDLAWEMHDKQGARLVHRVFKALRWTPQLRAQRYATARALAWHAFLSGEGSAAKDLFAEASALAPTQAWEVTSAVDAAYVLSLAGSEDAAWAALRDAQTLADAVDWQATRQEERMALVTMAALLAPHDARAAQRYIDVHYALNPHSLLENIANTHEPRRLQAYRKYADGQIAAVRGNTGLAVRLISDANEIFARIGFVFRAAVASQTLYRLTECHPYDDQTRPLLNLDRLCLELEP